MKFLSIYVQNFGSFYGRHHVALAGRGLMSVTGQNLDDPRSPSNGSGKSTLPGEALDWCLFGDVSKGDVADSVVNDEARKGCCVTVDLVDDAGRYIRITRVRDYPKLPNGPMLWVDQQNITALDARETQRLIQAHLGLDRDVFHAAVFFAQADEWRFADGTDGERKAVLTKVVPELAEVDQLLQKTQALLKRARENTAKLEGDHRAASERLRTLQSQDPRAQAATWEAQRQRDAEWWRAEAVRKAEALSRARAERAAHVIPTAGAQAMPPVPSELRQLTEAMPALEESARVLDGQVAVLRDKLQVIVARVRKIQGQSVGPCSACGQPVTAEHLAREVQNAQVEQEAVTTEGKQVRVQLDAARYAVAEARARIATLSEAWNNAKVEASRAAAAADAASRQAAILDRGVIHAEHEHQQAAARHAAKLAEVNPHLEGVEAWARTCQEAHDLVGVLEIHLLTARLRVTGLEFWEQGFGQKGLKSYVLDTRVTDLANASNRWVQLLTGGTAWVTFTTQREVGKGSARKLVEDLSMWVHRSNPDGTVTTRNYRSFSGGEKRRVALGVDFGLSRLLAGRARCAYDLLIADELFQKSLDAGGKEAVAELLSHLAKEKSSIFVVDHDVLFQNLFDTRMVTRKHHRRSRVVDGIYCGVEDGDDRPGSPGAVLLNHAAFPT